LTVVKVKYIGFDEKEHSGCIIIHKELAPDILAIFKALYQNRFPIADIHPAGRKPNTTIAYNCRSVSNQPGILSQHS
ncbi:MAG TPA: hypothetical protein PLD88_01870, partial [Candidatus Berkiella sp.]|nr:hypothetical protein [Candidatus Berkiella sp.]